MSIQDLIKQITSALGANAWWAIIWLLATIAASFVVRFIAARALMKIYAHGAAFLSTLLQVAVVGIGAYFVAFYAGADPTVIIAIIAIFSAGVSLSADSTFREVMAGAKIVSSSRMRPGELVTVGDGITGTILEVGLNATTIATDNGLVTISNHEIGENKLINHSRVINPTVTVPIPMSGDHDRMTAIDAITLAAQSVSGWKGAITIGHAWDGGQELYKITVMAESVDGRDDLRAALSLMITIALAGKGFPVGGNG